MSSPRSHVGHEYWVSVETSLGWMRRWIMAFDKEDALAQVVAYCDAEGLQVVGPCHIR